MNPGKMNSGKNGSVNTSYPALPTARSPEDFGKVAVLLGGNSAEREVSLASGTAVLEALRARDVDAHPVDPKDGLLEPLSAGGFDRVFIVLHGRGGEDGTMQGALELMGLPYTGSGVLGSALAMDKHRSKQLFRDCGLPTPDYVVISDERELAKAVGRLGFPLAIKPVHEGSSIGVSKVLDDETLLSAWYEAARFDGEILVERWIGGPEYTVSVLGRETLPLIRLETPRVFYDYEAKYADGAGTLYHCPSGLDAAKERALSALALAAFDALDAWGWGRVDLICDEQGSPYLIEVNTVPGMTGHSLVPMAAAALDMGFPELCWRILETSLAR